MTRFMMMVGLVGSGKSTEADWLSEFYGANIHSSDRLREELFGDVNENSKNDELFRELHRRIKVDLSNGSNVIYDATNINHKKRKAFLDGLSKIDCEKICYLIATPYEKCLKQNKLRDRQVPEHVIERMYKSIYIPQYYEGWDEIHLIYSTDGYKFDTNELFNGECGLNHINQDNPNHTLTIGQHCLKCAAISEVLSEDFQLSMAALYHDIGKKFTKQFKNAKGEDTEVAHYYNHHLVSAYDALFYLKDLCKDDILAITNYIQWHMQPFFINSEKAKNKFIKLVGQECYNKLMVLHESDVKAK